MIMSWCSTTMTVLKPIILSILLFSIYGDISCLADDPPTYRMAICPQVNYSYSLGSSFQADLNYTLFTDLPKSALQLGFYNITKGIGVDQVYALFYCRGDVTKQICVNCVRAAAETIEAKCKFLKEGIVYYDECTLRYANHSIFAVDDETNAYVYTEGNDVLDSDQELFFETTADLVNEAAYHTNLRWFAQKQVPFRCLVQCTPDIGSKGCAKCLNVALAQRNSWANTTIFLPSCSVSYGRYVSPDSHSKPHPRFSGGAIAGIVLGSIVAVAVLSAIYIFYFRKPPSDADDADEIPAIEGAVSYDYDEIAEATNDFSDKYVVGKGGFGKVYKVVLSNGNVVAVKKLNTEKFQGEVEFQSEIETLGRIHQKHLVSLLGCCIKDSQRLLIYEYMANNSLFYHLHGSRRRNLDWPYRKHIALGAANGLAYLHHSCEPRIIHRDIKSSNILLDSRFDAKISDFGLARLLPDDVTHLTTLTTGTFGYIAPEINMGRKGEISEKTDVYSFGVVLLELITGLKPEYPDWAKELIAEVFVNGDYDYVQLVDPRLKKYDRNEMQQVLECAVGCVNSSADKRPTMAKIVQILEDITSPGERTPVSRVTSLQQGWTESQDTSTKSSLPSTSKDRLSSNA